MLLHSILGTGTNTFAMTAKKIPVLRPLMTPWEWTHVQAFPSVLRLLYAGPLRQELRKHAQRADTIVSISFHRVIDNALITLSAEDFWIALNYQLIHLIDFLPAANWSIHQNDTSFILFRDLYDLLAVADKREAVVDYKPSAGPRKAQGERQGVGEWLTTLIPVSLSERMAADPAWNAPTDPAIEARFQRVKAKLFGFTNEPKDTLNRFPLSNQSIPARYARAYAFHKQSFSDKAVAETDALLATVPHDPYFEELKGQILLESGRPKDALPVLRDAVQRTNYQPLIAALFGHALIATEDRANYPEAKKVLRNAVQRDGENPFAWFQLGTIYSAEGDISRAALASAERFNLTGETPKALYNARIAMAGIPKGTPDWIRAQDIVMVSESDVDKNGKRRKKNGQ
jgi:tetratricopeptide (TPR) repeat protein